MEAAVVPIEFSVVVPFFNEGESAATLIGEIIRVMQPLGVYELVLVDDGSRDSTRQVLLESSRACPHPRVISFAQNRGQAAALYFGLHVAVGQTIVTMDGDGQNDPADIPKLLARLPEGDMVTGIRVNRQDSWSRRKMSRFANGIRSRILRDGVRDTGCALKVFRREVVSAFIPIRTLYSFMPAMTVAAGFKVVEEPVAHRPRLKGVSSYNLKVFLWRPVLDLLGVWWFSTRRFPATIPLR